MSTFELQNQLIRRILEISDQELLEYLFNLASKEKAQAYQLTDFEKEFILESLEEYSSGKIISNEDVFKKTDQWLSE